MNNPKGFVDTLKSMRGKLFSYAGKQYRLCDYTVDNHRQRVTIATDKRTFERSFADVEDLLSGFELEPAVEISPEFTKEAPVKTTAVTHPVQPPAVSTTMDSNQATVYEEHNSLARDLIGILRDNIEKVSKNKDYIPQAKAINNHVNSIINVTKLQLDVYKQFKPKKTA